MDGLSESAKSVEQNEGFVKHVFKFDDSTKKELLNIIQYAVLSVIPVVILNKSVQKLIPEADEEKGSIEILVEVLTQLIIMFLGMFFIHRIVSFVPTYSKLGYENFSVVNVVMAFMVIVLSLQTKLGLKMNILAERFMDLLEGQTGVSLSAKQDKPSAQTQKQATQGQAQGQVQQHQVSRGDFLKADDFKIPFNDMRGMPPPGNMPRAPSGMPQGPPVPPPPEVRNPPNFDSMFKGPDNPLVNANPPGMRGGNGMPAPSPQAGQIGGGMMEPMAANDALGGSFGSAF